MNSWFAFALLCLVPTLRAAEKFTSASIEPLYRAHRFATAPKLNPDVKFAIDEFEVPGLWAALEVQIFNVHDLIRGQSIPGNPFLCYRGKIHPFVESTGGQGLMSAVVAGPALYYSYSWGSGIHRSHVGRLQIVNDAPVRAESAALVDRDMFVTTSTNGRILVTAKSSRGPVPRDAGAPLGWIKLQPDGRLSIADALGDEILLDRR